MLCNNTTGLTHSQVGLSYSQLCYAQVIGMVSQTCMSADNTMSRADQSINDFSRPHHYEPYQSLHTSVQMRRQIHSEPWYLQYEEAIAEWFSRLLHTASTMGNHGFMFGGQAFQVEQFWSRYIDGGAMRTMWCYMKDLPLLAFTYVAWIYFEQYSSGQWMVWNVNNPSTALVSLLRHLFWEDDSFMRRYRVGRYAL